VTKNKKKRGNGKNDLWNCKYLFCFWDKNETAGTRNESDLTEIFFSVTKKNLGWDKSQYMELY